jgi:hypothetical protein
MSKAIASKSKLKSKVKSIVSKPKAKQSPSSAASKIQKEGSQHRAKSFIVLPIRKDNAKKEIASMLESANLRFDKLEEELIGNSPIVWITAPEEKKIINFFHKKGMKAFPSNTCIIKLKDRPGEVAKIARILMSSGIDVQDAHLILKDKSISLYGILTDKPAEANKMIQKILASLKEMEEESEESEEQKMDPYE